MEFGSVPIPSEDDWRASVALCSRLPMNVQIRPESASALRFMRDGRTMALPPRIDDEEPPSCPATGDDFGATFAEIADELEITRGRAQQIVARALRKLRHPSRAKLLRGFVA